MKPQRDQFTVQSTVTGEGVRMTIDPGSMQHIMDLVTDAYSDRQMAVLREYATNALDAHVEAGNPAPIEVITPSSLRPFLTIRDEGVGMDAEDIRAIYSQYGASTKRGTNAAVGMLGIGCKSALAYADQFTLIATKAGRRITVSVSRDDSGAGMMTILGDEPTDDPNGVAVQVPARRDNAFAAKAAELFRYWRPGTVLVNGEQPEPLAGYALTDDLLVMDGIHSSTSPRAVPRAVVVMGNVPYPAPQLAELNDFTLAYGKSLVARVEIGAVEFPPSREALKMTPTTTATLQAIANRFKAAKQVALQRDVDAAQTRGAAMAAQIAFQDAIGSKAEATWNGETVPTEIKHPTAGYNDGWWYLPDTTRYYRSSRSVHSRERTLAMSTAARATWVTGFSNRTWTSAMRDKLNRYCAAHSIDAHEFVLTPEGTLPSEWLESCRRIAWLDVREWKDPNRPVGAGGGGETYAGTYPTYLASGYTKKYPAGDIAKADPIFYADVGLPISGQGTNAAMLRDHFGENTVLVAFPETRRAKFLRTFPAARSMDEGMRKAAKAWLAAISADQLDALATFYGQRSYGRSYGRSYYYEPDEYGLTPAKVDDPALAHWIKLGRLYTQELHQAWTRWQRWLPDDADKGTAVPDASDCYPLLEAASDPRAKLSQHNLIYVNAVYNQEESN